MSRAVWFCSVTYRPPTPDRLLLSKYAAIPRGDHRVRTTSRPSPPLAPAGRGGSTRARPGGPVRANGRVRSSASSTRSSRGTTDQVPSRDRDLLTAWPMTRSPTSAGDFGVSCYRAMSPPTPPRPGRGPVRAGFAERGGARLLGGEVADDTQGPTDREADPDRPPTAGTSTSAGRRPAA